MLQKEIKRTKAEIRKRIDQKKKNCQNERHNQKQQKILGNNQPSEIKNKYINFLIFSSKQSIMKKEYVI